MGEATSEAKKSYARRFVRGSTLVFTAFVLSGVVGLLLRIFLARTLGAADYGLFITLFMFISMFALFRDPGIGQSLVKYIPEFVAKKRRDELKSSIIVYMLVQVLISLFVCLTLVVFSDQIASTIFPERMAEASSVIKILSGWFLFEAFFYTFSRTFQGFQDMVPFSLLLFLQISLPFLFALLLVGIFGLSTMGVALAYTAGLGAVVLFAFGTFLKKHSSVLKAKIRISKPLLKKLLMFALPVLLSGVAGAIIGYMSTLMIAIFRTSSEVGFYQVAYPAANSLLYFPRAMGVVLFPMISELWARRKHELIGGAMHTLIKFSFIFIAPAALIIIAFPGVVISLLFGSEYLAASLALQILALMAIVQTLYTISNRMILGIGKPAVITVVMVIMACFAFTLNLILIPPYGIEGAAVATFLSMLVGLSLSLYFARKYVKFTIPSSPLIKTLVGGLLTLLMVSGLKLIINLPPLLELFVVMIPSLLFYGAWILLTRALTWDDLLLLKNTMPIPKWLLRIARKFIGIKRLSGQG